MLKRTTIAAIIMALTFTFGANSAFAQDTVSHMEFKGIPLTGKIDNFVKKLQEQGYTLEKNKGNSAIMSGQFTGKDAEVYVFSTKKSNTVWKVVIYLPKQTSWYSIKAQYEYYAEMYGKKYGTPAHTFAFFSDPYYEGDGYEMQAVRNKKCHYFSSYHTAEGVISVEISEFEQVKIVYEDDANTVLMDSEKAEAVINDI